jgi:FkbM family methyltransferase
VPSTTDRLTGLRRRALRAGRDRLRAAGIEVRRVEGGPRRTLPEVLSHLRGLGLAPATVIDVGVAAGTPGLYAAFPDAALLLVEPVAEWHAQLEALGASRRVELVRGAAGPEPGSFDLRVHRVLACSSTMGSRRGDDAEFERRTVPVVPLDDAVRDAGLAGPYVVKVDVEGGELDVLAGASAVLEEADAVLLEVSLFQLNEGAPQFGDVVRWMHERGWVVYDLYDGHLRPLDGALAQVDVAFVKADGRFRASHAYATPEQADALYRSWGL